MGNGIDGRKGNTGQTVTVKCGEVVRHGFVVHGVVGSKLRYRNGKDERGDCLLHAARRNSRVKSFKKKQYVPGAGRRSTGRPCSS